MAQFLDYELWRGGPTNKLAGHFNPFSGVVERRAVWTDLTIDSFAGAVLVGPPREVIGGQEQIVIVGTSSAQGVLHLDVSAGEGCPWEEADSELVSAGKYCEGHAFTIDGEQRYRLRFVPTEAPPTHINFVSQARPA